MLKLLLHIKLLNPVRAFRLLNAFRKNGKNFVGFLAYLNKYQADCIALDDGTTRINYKNLYTSAINSKNTFLEDYNLTTQSKIAVIGLDSVQMTIALLGLSATGASTILVNPHLSKGQMSELLEKVNPSLILVDTDTSSKVSVDLTTIHLDELDFTKKRKDHKGKAMGNFTVLTSGTTGLPKGITRKSTITNFIPPFRSLINDVQLYKYKRIYIATPTYHGFGISALFIAIILGAEIHMIKKFDAAEMANRIEEFKIEVITVVPLMLDRLIAHTEEKKLKTNQLKCIISGGAALHTKTLENSVKAFGNIVWNLYGTSEAGFCIMSSPKLNATNKTTIGKPIRGVKYKIEGDDNELFIQAKWALSKSDWIGTGDSASTDEQGNLYLHGRTDDMIVSGGENVYPKNLEDALMAIEEINLAAALPVKDSEFGQRFEVYVELNHPISSENILEILKEKVARFEMPRQIYVVDKLPVNPIGKVNKRQINKLPR